MRAIVAFALAIVVVVLLAGVLPANAQLTYSLGLPDQVNYNNGEVASGSQQLVNVFEMPITGASAGSTVYGIHVLVNSDYRGPFILATYRRSGANYVLQGSYSFNPPVAGDQLFTVPVSARWPVQNGDLFATSVPASNGAITFNIYTFQVPSSITTSLWNVAPNQVPTSPGGVLNGPPSDSAQRLYAITLAITSPFNAQQQMNVVAPLTPWPITLLDYAAAAHRGQVVVTGGYTATSFPSVMYASQDAGVTWSTAGASFPARAGHLLVSFPNASPSARLLAIGGSTSSPINDVQIYTDSTSTWSQATAALPWSARKGQAIAEGWAASGSPALYIMGGQDASSSTVFADIWSSTDGITWSQVTVQGASWSARVNPAVAALSSGSGFVLAGGMAATGSAFNDVWVSNRLATSWTQRTASPWASGRFSASLVVANSLLYLFAGADSAYTTYNDVRVSTDNGQSWLTTSASSPFSRRSNAAAVAFGNQVVLLGGKTYTVSQAIEGVLHIDPTQEGAARKWDAAQSRYEAFKASSGKHSSKTSAVTSHSALQPHWRVTEITSVGASVTAVASNDVWGTFA